MRRQTDGSDLLGEQLAMRGFDLDLINKLVVGKKYYSLGKLVSNSLLMRAW